MKCDGFVKLMAYISAATIEGLRGDARRFRPGLDYTIAHYGQLIQSGYILDATLTFVDDSDQDKLLVWESDNAGGFECYTPADEDAEDTAEAAGTPQDHHFSLPNWWS